MDNSVNSDAYGQYTEDIRKLFLALAEIPSEDLQTWLNDVKIYKKNSLYRKITNLCCATNGKFFDQHFIAMPVLRRLYSDRRQQLCELHQHVSADRFDNGFLALTSALRTFICLDDLTAKERDFMLNPIKPIYDPEFTPAEDGEEIDDSEPE